jgi:predicted RNA-binding protein YlqC (UPF0109 family)
MTCKYSLGVGVKVEFLKQKFSNKKMANYIDKDFVEYVVKQIVNKPDEVEVTRKTDEMGVLIEVKVSPEDMGLLIGRSGSTAKAIRTLARIIGIRNNARVNLRIIEPEGSTHQMHGGAGTGEKNKTVENVMEELDM